MSDLTARTCDQARFAARAFLAELSRDLGDLGAVVTDRMLFAFETGYLRGWRDGARSTMQLFDNEEIKQ